VFAALGLGLSWYVYAYIKNTRMAMGIFFFFLMEFLQVRLSNPKRVGFAC
jgi:hypothetical protein